MVYALVMDGSLHSLPTLENSSLRLRRRPELIFADADMAAACDKHSMAKETVATAISVQTKTATSAPPSSNTQKYSPLWRRSWSLRTVKLT